MSVSPGNPGEIGAGHNIQADPAGARADDIRQLSSNIAIGSRLITSAVAFLFMSFLFAFLYLRAVNSNGLWRPKHEIPVQSWGIAVLVLTILATGAWEMARREVVSGTEARWRQFGLVALVLGVLVVVAQGLEYNAIAFKTAGGGWAAVFWGWTLVQLTCWLGALYWMETLVAQAVRRPPATPRLGTAGTELLKPSADGATVYLYLMSIVALVAYVLLYLVK